MKLCCYYFNFFFLAAVEQISKVANHINNLVQEQENMSRLVSIQRSLSGCGKVNIVLPGRKLIKEGPLMKVSPEGSTSTPRYLILLSDMVLYCKEWVDPDKLICLRVLPLNKCEAKSIMYKRGLFSISCQSVEFVFYTMDAPHATCSWVEMLQQAIDNVSKNIVFYFFSHYYCSMLLYKILLNIYLILVQS